MAISVFQLASALTESAAVSNVPAFEFATDNLQECTGEMNYMIMAEAADYREIAVSTNELLAESAINNPGAVSALDENIFTTLKDGIIKFFNKIIAMVKGLIEKIKAFFYKMTGKTDKWVSIMEPKINEAKRKTGYGDVSAERYNWDTKYVMTDMMAGVGSMVDDWRSAVGAMKSDKDVSLLADYVRDVRQSSAGYKGEDADSDKTKTAVKHYEDNAKASQDELESFKKSFNDTVAKAMGVSGSDLNTVWAEVTKKAHGGTNEKTERKYGNEVDAMLGVIKKSKDTIDGLKKKYEAHLKHLTTFKDALEKAGGNMDQFKSEDKLPADMVRAARESFKAEYNKIMEITKSYETAMNTARQMNTSFVQDMTTEYMTLLTKFAGFKGKKA